MKRLIVVTHSTPEGDGSRCRITFRAGRANAALPFARRSIGIGSSCKQANAALVSDSLQSAKHTMTPEKHRIEIRYCTQCRWMLRSAWMAQELLSTFDGDIESLTLRPGTGGLFEIDLDGTLLWSRKEAGRFPDIVELKQLVRDRIAPGRDLGHLDRAKK